MSLRHRNNRGHVVATDETTYSGLNTIDVRSFRKKNRKSMSQSIDFRINDLISEYLDYKGYTKTVSAFRDERQTRDEPIGKSLNGNLSTGEQEKRQSIQVKSVQERPTVESSTNFHLESILRSI